MHVNLQTQLLGGFGAVALACFIGGGVVWYSLSESSSSIEEFGRVHLPSVQQLQIISEAQTAIGGSEKALLNEAAGSREKEAEQDRLSQAWERANQARRAYESLPHSQAEQEGWTRFTAAWDDWSRGHQTLIRRVRDRDGQGAGDRLEAGGQSTKGGDTQWLLTLEANAQKFQRAKAELDGFVQTNMTAAKDLALAGVRFARVATVLMVIAVCIVGFLALGLGIYFGRSIPRALNRVIAALSSSSGEVASAAAKVAQASQSTAAGAGKQAASLEGASASLTQMSSMTKRTADNANQADAQAGSALIATQKGRDAARRMSEAVAKIKASTDQTSKIVKCIDEVAFQTNLLALNAAVEAARAGEAGKGFAVVAEEVRTLARRSAEAAESTAALIEESLRNAGQGVSTSSEVTMLLEDIGERMGTLSQLIGEVSTATDAQAQGIDQVNLAVAQMDKVTRSNLTTAEQSASASEALSAQADDLRKMVSALIDVVEGGHQANHLGQMGSVPSYPASRGGPLDVHGTFRAAGAARAGQVSREQTDRAAHVTPEDATALER